MCDMDRDVSWIGGMPYAVAIKNKFYTIFFLLFHFHLIVVCGWYLIHKMEIYN